MISRTILAVDDNPVTRKIYRSFFRDSNLLLAEDGEKAAALLADPSVPVDIILLDLNMPGLTGAEFLRALKAIPHRTGVPVLIVTAAGKEDPMVEEAMPLAAGYLRKPLKKDSLVEMINRLLKASPRPADPPPSGCG